MATGLNLGSGSVAHMVTTVSAISGLSNRVVTIPVGSEEALLNLVKSKGFPSVGVVYMGKRSAVTDLKQKGLALDLTIDLYIVHKRGMYDKVADIEAAALNVNESIMDAVKHTCGPSSRPWRFIYEIPVPMELHLLYVQRWATRMIAT